LAQHASSKVNNVSHFHILLQRNAPQTLYSDSSSDVMASRKGSYVLDTDASNYGLVLLQIHH